jgi:SSS family solute:Na+ symporter
MFDVLPFGVGAWFFVAAYLCSVLLIGWVGYNARRDDTLRDFYLAGGGFGFLVLFLTLYATQYSGNSLFGFTGAAYRLGFGWLISVHFMLAVIVFYLAFAPKLHTMAHKGGYVTPVDFLQERFGSAALSLLASIVMIIALTNYLLAQLMTMGRMLQGFSGPYGDVAYNYGVVALALIMLIYGTLGGIRAVAWTDVLQGGVLMLGFSLLLVLLFKQFGPLSLATELIAASARADRLAPPDADMLRQWLSYILVVGMGGALYPHAIQRIYAARSKRVLNRSMAFMAFLPFGTTLIAVVAGVYALAYIPGLEGADADQVLAQILRIILEGSFIGYSLVVLIFSAVLAALMSTADSALLSISSMFTKDIYGVHFRSDPTESTLTRIGKRCSWLVVGVLVVIAILLKDQASLITLFDRKFDVLVQLAPAIMLGVHWPELRGGPVLTGLVVGLIVSLSLAFGPFDFVVAGKVWGFHPGLYGLAANLAIAVGGSLIPRRS